ncbi:MAG: N-acetylmuramic acid 6-phosphate etherase [Crocinitomicaceae bacterium]|nr:N-acetylmuramic acid 6-phosphate etherase [Crocinitomicaceae bacterium]
MSKLPPTEQSGRHGELHQMSVSELVNSMNAVDSEALVAVTNCKDQISAFVEELVPRMMKGGRLFYVGAGTSGRLGVVDASECPPTFGVEPGRVVGLIAGGDSAIRKAVEGAEDSTTGGWDDLQAEGISENDTVVGIAASGRTPYVVGALKKAKEHGMLTGCVTCNPGTEVSEKCDYPIEAITGPEFVTGSTRLKAGTATKLVLNMITTITMIQLGHVKGNRMVDMQLSNEKLVERGTRMVAEATGVGLEEAKELLLKHGSVRNAVDAYS